MKKAPWAPSFERGRELVKLGVALPYLDRQPGNERPRGRALYVSQLHGYFESLAIRRETSTDYVIALRVGTDLSRTIVNGFSIIPPWPEQQISWDFDAAEQLSESVTKSLLNNYERLFEPRLLGVLTHRRALYGGCPLEGLLFGRALTPIPASVPREASAAAEIVLSSASGARVRAPIHLWIHNPRRRSGTVSERKLASDVETASVSE